MTRDTRRSLDSQRVIAWLNGEDNGPGHGLSSPQSRGRIVNLIAAIQELNALAKKKLKQAGRDKWPKCHFCNNFPKGKMARLLSEIEARFADYPTSTNTVYMGCMGQVYIDDGAITGRRPHGEWFAAQAVRSLANDSAIERVNQCGCGRYFFATFEHKRFCSVKCRRQHNQGSRRYKASRREYMRWYYAMYQSPNQPSRKLSFEHWRDRQRSSNAARG